MIRPDHFGPGFSLQIIGILDRLFHRILPHPGVRAEGIGGNRQRLGIFKAVHTLYSIACVFFHSFSPLDSLPEGSGNMQRSAPGLQFLREYGMLDTSEGL